MRILVTTPTGNIGRRIVDRLLETDHALTLLVRDPSRLPADVRQRATIVQGSLDDPAAVDAALSGADAAFFLVPPPPATATHWRRFQESFGEVFTHAAVRAGTARVVFISSSGAQHDDIGAISGGGAVERLLTAALPNVVVVRAGYFMENVLGSLSTIASQGTIYGALPADIPFGQVATRDIGDVCVRWLTDATWAGHRVVAALGPALLSMSEQARTLTEVLGRPVTYVQIPPSALREALLQAGLPRIMAEGYEEMMAGVERHLQAGDYRAEADDESARGPTSFRAFAGEVVGPAIEALQASAAV